METTRATAPHIEQLKSNAAVLSSATEVHLKLVQPASVLLKLDDHLRVNATEALMGDLERFCSALAR